MPGAAEGGAQAAANEALWADHDLLRHYTGRTLRPVEVLLLVRQREALSGKVLELGCGGGRLSGYLTELAAEFHGIDISPTMVAYCRRLYPGSFHVRDLRELAGFPERDFDVVFASYNVLDILDDAERRRVIGEIGELLAPGGLLLFSSHNLAHAPAIPRPTAIRAHDPLRATRELLRMPRRVRNHRRLQRFQRRAEDHAILIDDAHDFAILHYYIGRDDQQRQLAALGFELERCLELDGREISPGEPAAGSPELHYVARRVAPRS
jgi:SAM-dependent methyltransferase